MLRISSDIDSVIKFLKEKKKEGYKSVELVDDERARFTFHYELIITTEEKNRQLIDDQFTFHYELIITQQTKIGL